MSPADLIQPEAERIAQVITETDFMAHAIAEAQKAANAAQVEIAIVHAPIEHAEEIARGGNPFGWAALPALRYVYKQAEIICTVKPQGKACR
jgi:hypothetical protein